MAAAGRAGGRGARAGALVKRPPSRPGSRLGDSERCRHNPDYSSMVRPSPRASASRTARSPTAMSAVTKHCLRKKRYIAQVLDGQRNGVKGLVAVYCCPCCASRTAVVDGRSWLFSCLRVEKAIAGSTATRRNDSLPNGNNVVVYGLDGRAVTAEINTTHVSNSKPV